VPAATISATIKTLAAQTARATANVLGIMLPMKVGLLATMMRGPCQPARARQDTDLSRVFENRGQGGEPPGRHGLPPPGSFCRHALPSVNHNGRS
jgi:hypothetical protein